MVAGATGIDLYLMVVAADDGVMPQTREHAAVLAALGVSVGVVAVTKADLADPARAVAEAAALLPGARRGARVGAHGRGAGRASRRAVDSAAAARGPRAASTGALRLHVDRAFTIRGAGTVVTGTLWSGEAARGDRVTILPAGRAGRIRGVEVHDESVERAEAGQRVALNLAGVDRDEVARGDVIVAATPRSRRPTASTSRSRGPRRSRGPTAARAWPSITARARPRRGSPSSAAASSSCGSRSRSCRCTATGS